MSQYDAAFSDPYHLQDQGQWGVSVNNTNLERISHPGMYALISILTHGLFNLFWYHKNTPKYVALSGRDWRNHKQLFWIHVGFFYASWGVAAFSTFFTLAFFSVSLAAWAIYVKEFLACRDAIALRSGVIGLRPANEILLVRIGLGVAVLIAIYLLGGYSLFGFFLAWVLLLSSELMYWLYTYWILTSNNGLVYTFHHAPSA